MRLRQPPFDTYEGADAYLGGRNRRALSSNTVLHRPAEGAIAVRYWDTDVVTYVKDSPIVILQAGGWVTATTTSRMHAFTPANIRVRRQMGDFHVTDCGGEEFTWDGEGMFYAYTAPLQDQPDN